MGDFDLKVCLMWHELLRAPFGGVFHRHADRITKPFLMIHGRWYSELTMQVPYTSRVLVLSRQ